MDEDILQEKIRLLQEKYSQLLTQAAQEGRTADVQSLSNQMQEEMKALIDAETQSAISRSTEPSPGADDEDLESAEDYAEEGKEEEVDEEGEEEDWDWDEDDVPLSDWFDTNEASHTFAYEAVFKIRVRVKDSYGMISEWSEPHSFSTPYPISIPTTYNFQELLIQKFPNFFNFLKTIFGN